MKQKLIKTISYWMSVIVVGIVLGISLQFVKAWTEPASIAPNGNVGAPINASGVTQTKTGLLGVGSLYVSGLSAFDKSIKIGTGAIDPSIALDVEGSIRQDVKSANLAADANGKIIAATSGSGASQWTTNGTSIYYNTGNVGIGTATPAAKLDVSGDVHASKVFVDNLTPTAGSELASKFYVDGKVAAAAAGGSSGSYYTKNVSGTGPIYCLTGDVMTGGGCWATDVTSGSDSSGYGGRPVGENGWECMGISGNSTTSYIRCVGSSIGLYGNDHTLSDCTSAGGTVMADGTNSYCQLSGSCPSGWTQYNNFSTTQAKTCTGVNDKNALITCTGATSCTTGSHSFSNTAIETCSYNNRDTFGLICLTSAQSCTATINKMGCY